MTALNAPDPSLHLPDAPVTSGDPLPQMLLRVIGAVTLGGLGGTVLGLLTRATAGVVSLIAGYAVLAEGFIAQGVAGGAWQPWLVRLNVEAFVGKGATYLVQTCGPQGCTGTEATLSYTHGWVYLLALTLAGVAAALAVFRRRDLT